MLYLVTYDLNKSGQDYKALHEAIKSLGNWWHYLDSTWLVKSRLTVQQVTDHLTPRIDDNDRLLVLDVTGVGYNGWLTQDAWKWIGENING